jgi:hypothetical protein
LGWSPVTQAVLPSWVITIASGQNCGVLTGLPTFPVSTLIGYTLSKVAMQAVFPSGVNAMNDGPLPTLIGLPALFVAC